MRETDSDLIAMVARAEEQLDRVRDLESQLKTEKETLRNMLENVLPEAMDAADVTEIWLTDGQKATLKTTYHASVTEENRAAAHAWLIDTKRDHLLKRRVTVQFGLKEFQLARQFENMVRRIFPDKAVTLSWNGEDTDNPDAFYVALERLIDTAFEGHKLTLTDTVPGSTLVAFAKVMLQKGEDWPAELFGAYQRRALVIPPPKVPDNSVAGVIG